MSLIIVPFREVEVGARFHFNGIEYFKGENDLSYRIMDSDEPVPEVLLDNDLCSTKVDPRTGKKSL